jgi:hypothetical protein
MGHVTVVPINRKQDHSQSTLVYVAILDEGSWGAAPGQAYQSIKSPSIPPVYEDDGIQRQTWAAKFSRLSQLQDGWNGYTAPAPTENAIFTARDFVYTLLRAKYEPKRLAPSSVGGVGVTQRKGNKSVYVEFYNDGRVLALFSDDLSEPVIKRIEPGYQSFKKLIAEMRDYLDD